jgi:hypothetical protein
MNGLDEALDELEKEMGLAPKAGEEVRMPHHG